MSDWFEIEDLPENPKPQKYIYLIIRPDSDDLHYSHFQDRVGDECILTDFPALLRARTNLIVYALQQLGVERLEYDSRNKDPVRINGKAFDLRLLTIRDAEKIRPHDDEDVETNLKLVEWWMGYTRRHGRCQPDQDGKQQHDTWKCDCGEDVSFRFMQCSSRICSSWSMIEACYDKKELQSLTDKFIKHQQELLKKPVVLEQPKLKIVKQAKKA